MNIDKSKRVVLVAHCVLNQNTVVDGLERVLGAFPLAQTLVASGVGILQLPCPEFFMMNLDRPGMSYDEYNQPELRAIARDLLKPVFWQVDQYRRFGYELIGLIGIQDSPNCALSGQRGVFMEELMEGMGQRGIQLPLWEVPDSYGLEPGDNEVLQRGLMKFLEE